VASSSGSVTAATSPSRIPAARATDPKRSGSSWARSTGNSANSVSCTPTQAIADSTCRNRIVVHTAAAG
jgi:hypothetical protein